MPMLNMTIIVSISQSIIVRCYLLYYLLLLLLESVLCALCREFQPAISRYWPETATESMVSNERSVYSLVLQIE